MPSPTAKKKLTLPIVLSVVVVGGAASLASCGNDRPSQDGAAMDAVSDATQDASPDVPVV
jgi:hypothetical protein